ncbi:hypothetical protein Bbelb_210250 [Branchiostoma belcheri]|nr:hypothetical protein Bbelb_210250 [Branchiostoma belcheri]
MEHVKDQVKAVALSEDITLKRYDFFIIYCGKNSAVVSGIIIPRLTDLKITYCEHQEHFIPGRDIFTNIQDCISQSTKKDYEIVSPECGELRILRYNSRRHDSTSMIFGRQITAVEAEVKYKFRLRGLPARLVNAVSAVGHRLVHAVSAVRSPSNTLQGNRTSPSNDLQGNGTDNRTSPSNDLQGNGTDNRTSPSNDLQGNGTSPSNDLQGNGTDNRTSPSNDLQGNGTSPSNDLQGNGTIVKVKMDKKAKSIISKGYDFFIIYCGKNSAVVNGIIIPRLTELNITYCEHQEHFIPGRPVFSNIEDCIEHSRKVLAVFSADFFDSPWCCKDLEMALVHATEKQIKDFITPIKIDDCVIPSQYGDLKNITYSDLTASPNDWGVWEQIRCSLASIRVASMEMEICMCPQHLQIPYNSSTANTWM